MLREFKEFALRGSMVDLAVGIVIGTAFGKAVTSFVDDILMPPLGLLLGKVDFTNLFIPLFGKRYATLSESRAAGISTLNYGLFITHVVDFLVVAAALFFVVRLVNRLRRQPEVATTRPCPYCISSIPLKATRCPRCTSAIKSQD